MPRILSLVPVMLVLAAGLLSGCSAPQQKTEAQPKMAPVSALPKAMQSAPARVRTAYQFAVANPDALANVPCYCGCGSMGHKSNLACYVKEQPAGGQVVFDDHALGCSLCVDISQDVMRKTAEGMSAETIRADIVAAYSKFGPPNQ